MACEVLRHQEQPSILQCFSSPIKQNKSLRWKGGFLSKEKSAPYNSSELDKNPRPSSAKVTVEPP